MGDRLGLRDLERKIMNAFHEAQHVSNHWRDHPMETSPQRTKLIKRRDIAIKIVEELFAGYSPTLRSPCQSRTHSHLWRTQHRSPNASSAPPPQRDFLFEGLFTSSEEKLLSQDIYACIRALEVADQLGYGVGNTTSRAAIAYKQTQVQARNRLAEKLHRFRQECLDDCRFTDQLYSNTKTWYVSFRPRNDLPNSFPSDFSIANHRRPLRGRAANVQLDFTLADINDLQMLSYVAGRCLDCEAVLPNSAPETLARQFYGDFMGGEQFNLDAPPVTTYFSRPIITSNYCKAVRAIYPNLDSLMPATPSIHHLHPAPPGPCNDIMRQHG
ncbi:hypothetical protein BKA63DRAFT_579914 [Paraphoma chrysanthemicola]|nr:hypothetical protein BKA63DRAFT_579914 [Paraphoma chrysanthemicola]